MLYANKFSRKKKVRPSGGIAVYYKDQLKRYISLVTGYETLFHVCLHGV